MFTQKELNLCRFSRKLNSGFIILLLFDSKRNWKKRLRCTEISFNIFFLTLKIFYKREEQEK